VEKMKTKASQKPSPSRARARKWSARVTRNSHAMDLAKNVFKGNDPKKIARSVKRSSGRSSRRQASPYRSAVSMISFYENRGGKNLSPSKKKVLRRAKRDLKREFGRDKG
jgi:hypothetical protein